MNVSLAAAFEATLTGVTATKMHVEIRVPNQIWLNRKDIGTVNAVFKVTGLLYFKQTETFVRLGHIVPAKVIMKVCP